MHHPTIISRSMRRTAALLIGLLAGSAMAAGLEVTVALPRLNVAEYHRPYVAIWLEQEQNRDVTNLAVWYDLKLADQEGEKWLKDMRQWWRRSGRSLTMPLDGVSGATRTPGSHTLHFDNSAGSLAGLAPGRYRLVVEAVREVGGRELLEIPFQWPPAKAETLKVDGDRELDRISLQLTP